MLYFIGLGLDQSPSIRSLRILADCDSIFYESYTSPIINENSLVELRERIGNSKVENVKREFVEDGRSILETAKNSRVSLVCSGDPMVATTHQELRTRAIKQGIETKIIHGSSVLSAVSGELGLHSYNFGRIVTITKEPMQYTAYNTIFRNLLTGLHTIVLLEWDASNNFFLEPKLAAKSLLEAENDLHNQVLTENTLMFVVSRMGTEELGTKAVSFKEIANIDIGGPPHVLVIPGKLHFTEREALGAIFKRSPESFQDNSEGITRISKMMVTKYSVKTLKALERAKAAAAKKNSTTRFAEVFENVECYTQDAGRFLNEGKDELAVLSIGYAEGLLDSLRFGGQLEFEW
jgi:diphthine synthase